MSGAELTHHSATKVLVISEALGTPSAPGATCDYAVAWLEQLRDLGAEISLVLERPFSLDGLAAARPPSPRHLALSEVHAIDAYLSTGFFLPRLSYSTALGRLISRFAPGILRLWSSSGRSRMQPAAVSQSLPVDVPSPSGLGVLGLVDRIVLARRFYSSARLRAAQRTGIPVVDCSGYDLVLVEGLSPIGIVGVPLRGIVSLIGGVASLRSPLVEAGEQDFRLQGFLSVTQRHGTLVFSSEADRTEYGNMASTSPSGHVMTVPLISRRIQRLASATEDTGATTTILSDAIGEHQRRDRVRRLEVSSVLATFLAHGPAPGWNADLPFLLWIGDSNSCVREVARIAEQLEGAANIVLLLPDGPSLCPDCANLVLLHERGDTARLELIAAAEAVLLPHAIAPASVLLEALAIGRPAVCVDGAPCRELCRDAAIYARSNAEPDLARACRDLLRSLSALEAAAHARRKALASKRGEAAGRLAILKIMRNATSSAPADPI